MITLRRAERQYLHIPFWGLGGTVPEVTVGATVQPMVLDASYTPPAGWTSPDGLGSPQWYRVLLAGPDATGNPGGTIVVTRPPGSSPASPPATRSTSSRTSATTGSASSDTPAMLVG